MATYPQVEPHFEHLFPENQSLPQAQNMNKEEQSSVPVTSTVITIQNQPVTPDYVVWSLFNTIFMNVCCLGFVAYSFSVKSRDRKMVGDLNGAQNFASTAKRLNICALVSTIIVAIICIIVITTTSVAVTRYVVVSQKSINDF